MSSRLVTRSVSRSRSASAVASNSARCASVHCTSAARRLDTDALIEAIGVRRSWLTAPSNAVRARSDSVRTSTARAASASRRCRSAAPTSAANAVSRRWSSARNGCPTRARIRSAEMSAVASAVAADAGASVPTAANTVHPMVSRGSGPWRCRRLTPRIPNVSWTRPSRADRACSPRSRLPARAASVSASAPRRAANADRRADRSTTRDTSTATSRKITTAAMLSPLAMVKV